MKLGDLIGKLNNASDDSDDAEVEVEDRTDDSITWFRILNVTHVRYTPTGTAVVSIQIAFKGHDE
jgi:hypothetical protein